MEPSSVPAHRGCVPWQRLQLAVILLTFWTSHATALITIESPPVANEGDNVLLLVHNQPTDIYGYFWFTGRSVVIDHLIIAYGIFLKINYVGPAYSNREILYSNGSLLLQNITREDMGYFTLQVTKSLNQTEHTSKKLRVHYGPDVPTISPSDSYFSTGSKLRLFCQAASDPPAQYSWSINGKPQEATQELFIPSLSVNNSGSYTCHVHNSATGLSRTTVKTITVSEGRGGGGGGGGGVKIGFPALNIPAIIAGVLAAVAFAFALTLFCTCCIDIKCTLGVRSRNTKNKGKKKEKKELEKKETEGKKEKPATTPENDPAKNYASSVTQPNSKSVSIDMSYSQHKYLPKEQSRTKQM